MTVAHFPDNILTAIKEAVIAVFWKKEDVRKLFTRCQVPAELVSAQDWTAYKIKIVSPVLDQLNETGSGLGPLRRIVSETLEYKDGKHLAWVSDSEKRMRDAERALEHLRLLVKENQAAFAEKKAAQEKRQRESRQGKGKELFQKKLTEIKDRFYGYFKNPNRQERGYALEEILFDMFDLFDLSPRGPFRRVGEQIDGAFIWGTEHYIIEAKWQAVPSNAGDLRDLDGAVGSSLDNTLGLFISLNGFSDVGLAQYITGNRPKIFCMDGADLAAVLEQKIDLIDLLQRKKDLAVQKQRIFVRVNEIFGGNC